MTQIQGISPFFKVAQGDFIGKLWDTKLRGPDPPQTLRAAPQ